MPPPATVVTTADLAAADLAAVRALMDAAFDDFSDDDWAHALGGWHALIREQGVVVAHGSVVARWISIGDREFRAGYVEAVGVAPRRQRQGLGTAVTTALCQTIRTEFEIGVLSSGEWGFYERLGWERWRGPTFVRGADGSMTRTPDDDDGVMVLRVGPMPAIDPTAPIACDARSGDAW
ncbi:MAG: GNAT family N-acetyltransferase [Vicinamibacterales bacterium]